eukprot:jgi/Ulvmu1/10785/UM069_0019.1
MILPPQSHLTLNTASKFPPLWSIARLRSLFARPHDDAGQRTAAVDHGEPALVKEEVRIYSLRQSSWLRAERDIGAGVVVAVGTLAWHGVKNSQVLLQTQSEIRKLQKALHVSTTVSRCITDDMLRQMFRGLEGDTKKSSLLMLPSWLPSLPSGDESGAVLAVDFGGTSFRVMQVVLGDDAGDVKLMRSTEVDIPSAIYTGTVLELYEFIAGQVVTFVKQHGIASSTSVSDASTNILDAPATTDDAGPSQSATAAAAPADGDGASAPGNGAPAGADGDGATGLAEAVPADSSGTASGGRVGPDDLKDWADVDADRDSGSAETGDGALYPPLGFCFSFPMVQSGPTTGKLVRWTKGFDVCDGVGSNPAECLARALQLQGWRGGVAALLNDGVGIFGAARYQHPRTTVSMILGTGTNAGYAEKIANIPAMKQLDAPEDATTVVNTEWGAFSSEAIPRCRADAALDAASVRPGTQPFEKLVSGMYIPEIVRRSFLEVAQASGVLTPATWGRLALEGALSGPQVAAIDDDGSVAQSGTAGVLMHALGMRRSHCSLLTCWTLKQVVEAVVERAARVLAAGLLALLLKVGAPDRGGTYAIAVDGSVYHKYTKLRHRLHAAVAAAVAQHGGALEASDAPAGLLAAHRPARVRFQVEFVGVQGGSCFGAAVIAASQATKGS